MQRQTFDDARERRLGQRVRAVRDVVLHYRGVPVGTAARTRNVSLRGICVESGWLAIVTGAVVQIELMVDGRTGKHRARLPARVTYRSGRTLGLRLLGFDRDVFRWICELLPVDARDGAVPYAPVAEVAR